MNVPIWPGSSSFAPGDTPFGFYDTESSFQVDADKVTTWCARRLGYPIENIELQDIQFYAAFEEAVTTYGNEVYQWKIRENYLTFEGASTQTNLNNKLITPGLSQIIRIASTYGAEAGAGGNVRYYTGSIQMTPNQQNYDMNAWAAASASLASGSTIEIKRIFF